MVVLSCAGCTLEIEVIPGAHVDYGHDPALEPCAGNAPYVDGFSPFAARLLGVSKFNHVSFSWLPYEEFGSGRLRRCKGVIGCTNKQDAYSQWPIHLHEESHALMYAVNERPLPFLQEGLATAFDLPPGLTVDSGKAWGLDADSLRSELIEREHIDYDMAGLFSLYLLQRHGAEKFVTLYRRSWRDADLAEIDALLVEVYGFDSEALIDAFLSDTSCPADVEPFPWYDCEAPVVPAQDGGWLFERTLDCSNDDVFGGAQSEWGIFAGATFVVEDPGLHTVVFSGPERSISHVAPCGGCRWNFPQAVTLPDDTNTVYLHPGVHIVTARVFEQESTAVRVSITRAP